MAIDFAALIASRESGLTLPAPFYLDPEGLVTQNPLIRKIDRGQYRPPLLSDAARVHTEICPRNPRQLRGHQHVGLTFECERRSQVGQRELRQCDRLGERDDNTRLQVRKQVRLHVHKEREGRLGARILVPIHRELRH
jgi:hypothetical protein